MIVFRIREVRKNKKISLKMLSKNTGISRAYLYDLENNRRTNPSIKILLDIAESLNVNIKELFYTKFDIEDLKNKLYILIEKTSINSKETLELSKLIDLLINIKINEELQK